MKKAIYYNPQGYMVKVWIESTPDGKNSCLKQVFRGRSKTPNIVQVSTHPMRLDFDGVNAPKIIVDYPVDLTEDTNA